MLLDFLQAARMDLRRPWHTKNQGIASHAISNPVTQYGNCNELIMCVQIEGPLLRVTKWLSPFVVATDERGRSEELSQLSRLLKQARRLAS